MCVWVRERERGRDGRGEEKEMKNNNKKMVVVRRLRRGEQDSGRTNSNVRVRGTRSSTVSFASPPVSLTATQGRGGEG